MKGGRWMRQRAGHSRQTRVLCATPGCERQPLIGCLPVFLAKMKNGPAFPINLILPLAVQSTN